MMLLFLLFVNITLRGTHGDAKQSLVNWVVLLLSVIPCPDFEFVSG